MENLTLSTVADVLGIVGFIVTLFVWRLTGKLSKKFLRRARVPQLRGDLSQLSSELLIAMKPKNIDDVGGILSRIESSLDSAAGKISFWSRGDIRRLRKKIKVVRLENVYEVSRIRPIHNEVLGVIEVLKNIEKDNSWESVE
ncbi:TPA: hypothetical protein ACKPYB_001206 [Stenotrophomonas maltophilia]|jgi:hypothetical protein|uniref:hypothetical protein n=1 Tax=Stenotrophomonas TaxID=40323 RepID=UPI001AA16520|nr:MULTISPECIES: hypothetical protein [Stenotrophomonas]ELF4107739.1 hypothetical protein [Stenotrophomonas maltophilia]MBO1745493.1 hypothetical protein [Stenotrophomonas maltophilia]WAP03589.1 hypothetical protein FQS62_008935 [Stenotrophomonas sp. SBJS02]HEA4091046.1 hypothetical protein [Stenotrophomonas maltophilia]HEA4094957.1 hypothetical protein [Stenotrophomonas maltophilia]